MFNPNRDSVPLVGFDFGVTYEWHKYARNQGVVLYPVSVSLQINLGF